MGNVLECGRENDTTRLQLGRGHMRVVWRVVG